ncbi:FG-GAP-like repeat-containing protein [Streptomyces sp. WG7]|uniref:FG-GAP-like repeat-containing protein n=1 Tax=Streptomyces sp. WG7 TaxID=3417650 RepID=UPI003CF7C084
MFGPTALPASAAEPPAVPGGILFDDFHYTGVDDPALAAHGWSARTGVGGPGVAGATWSAGAVTFPVDPTATDGRVAQLRASTDGTPAGTVHAQLSTTQRKFYSGTYAARVHFDDSPATGTAGGDHPVQAFYAISPESPLYSELDFEYLPKGGWGVSTPSLFTTAWYNSAEDRTSHYDAGLTTLRGWHTLQMTVSRGQTVFYVDGKEYFRPAAKFSPREPMTINFNEWFIDLAEGGAARVWEQKADWVYYDSSSVLTPEQVDAAVRGYAASGTRFVDTVAKPTTNDHDGDGIGDVSLVYDYGVLTSPACAQSGTVRTATFGLPGKKDHSGGLDTLVARGDDPCRPTSPKFVTAGDFNGDGKSDTAAFYSYGNTDSSCPRADHVAIVQQLADPDGSGTLQAPRTIWESTCWGAGTKAVNSGDFNGDGKADLALLYDYGAGHIRLFTLDANAGGVTTQWERTTPGPNPTLLTTGDYNGDGKTDVAALYSYGKTDSSCPRADHVAIVQHLADPDGSGTLQAPRTIWESTCWGAGTKAVNSGDFNGDGKADLALLYDYGAGHIRLFTLDANARGVTTQWERTATGGPVARFMTTGDYNGDAKSDVALFDDYGTVGATCAGNAHQAVQTFTADPYGTGALHKPVKAWESTCWGESTKFMN